MATSSHPPETTTNGTTTAAQPTNSSSSIKPIQLSIPLPNSPGTSIYLHLTLYATSLTLFLTSAGTDSTSSAASLGSFVYAMPDRYNPQTPLSTPLYTLPSSLDFSTRLAKILARRTGQAAYVGSSVSFAGAGNGGTVEEEMEGFRRVVEVVMRVIERERKEKVNKKQEEKEEVAAPSSDAATAAR